MSVISRVKAAALFRQFHGRLPEASEIAVIGQTAPEESLEVGELYGIMYKVKDTKEPYLHRFSVRARPKLFVSADGKQIYIIGGRYRFTDRGFIG